MSIKLNRRSRIGMGVAALAVIAAGLPLAGTASALPPGTAPTGAATITPAGVKTSGTTYQLNLPGGASCPGDATIGYRWTTYITPIGNDPASMTFATIGGTPSGPAFSSALRNPGGALISAQSSLGIGSGQIALPAGGVSLSFQAMPVPAGEYNVGIACTLNTGGIINNERFWNTTMTVTAAAGAGPQNFNWDVGTRPAAPVLTTSSYNTATTTATVNFTHTASNPATTGYTATLTQVSGPAAPIAPIAVAAGATSFQVPGVALGSSYTVGLVATNATGVSAASNSLTVVGAATAPAPVVTAPDAFFNTALTVSWVAPTGVAPLSYDVAITPGGPSFTGVVGLSQVIPAGLATGGYTATVTPVYAAGSGVTATPGVDTFNITPNSLIVQELTVTRPAGALILTQRCGVYNDLPAFTAVDNFPGFPFGLAAETATADQVGTSPDINLSTPGVQVDPEFGNYPLPTAVSYPTECGLSMGTARFITQGNLAGQFFAANGRLNEVTVLDTRDGDAGWTLRGDIEDRFTSLTNGDSFSGDYLGWRPVMTDDSDIVGGEGPNGVGPLYNQTVTAGAPLLPGDGFPAGGGYTPGPTGLTDNPILAQAAPLTGLGIATLDARLQLLIPTSVDAANYSATLSLTVA